MTEQHYETTGRINELCDLILIYEDNLDFDEAERYIREHIEKNIEFREDSYTIRSLVQNKVEHYIENSPSNVQLFAFSSDNNFHKYRKNFRDYYIYFYKTTQYSASEGVLSSLIYPIEFEYIFNFIQEVIDFHTLYNTLSNKMIQEVIYHTTKIAKEATTASQQAAEDAATNAKIASTNAKTSAQRAAYTAVEEAIGQIMQKRKIEKVIKINVNNEVDNQMNKVTSKISETSVTILGIFAGIVLTIVAGLFYSSSVIESINSASIPKLILVATLVGFICINIIAVMFHYIDRFRVNKTTDTQELDTLKEEYSKDGAALDLTEDKKINEEESQLLKEDRNSSDSKISKKRVLSNKGLSYYFNAFKENHTFVYLLNFVLLIVLAVSIGLYVWFCMHPSSHENIIEQSNSNISVDVNISKGDATTTDSNTMDSPIDREPLDKSALDETTDSTLSDIVNTPSPDNIAP